MKDTHINDFECKKKNILEIAKLFSEIPKENEEISIKDKMLILQDDNTVDATDRSCSSFKTSNLYNGINLKYDVHQSNPVIKKKRCHPSVSDKRLEVGSGALFGISSQFISCEPKFVALTSEENSLLNHSQLNDFSGDETVVVKEDRDEISDRFINDKMKAGCTSYSLSNLMNHKERSDISDVFLKREIGDSNDGKSEAANEIIDFDFIKEEVSESEEIVGNDMKFCSEDTRKFNNMEEPNESFDEEMSASGEEIYSSDIEEMFNNKERKEENGNIKVLECSTCGKTFKSEFNLEKHILSHTNQSSETVRKFECETCGKSFKKKHHLQRHYLSHSKSKNFECVHCAKCYKDKYDLKKHMASIHTATECSVCGIMLENHVELRKHSVTHKKPKKQETLPIICHICNKTFREQRYLKRHLQMHAKFTPFACEICPKSFMNRFLLHEHARTHTGEKPFKCDKCDSTFSTKSNLVRHSRTHLKMKKCRKCFAEFENEEEFKAHNKSCILSYECGKCGWISERLGNIRRHVKNHAKYSSSDAPDSNCDSVDFIVRIL